MYLENGIQKLACTTTLGIRGRDYYEYTRGIFENV